MLFKESIYLIRIKLKYFTAENAVISYMYLVCFVVCVCVLRLISMFVHMISSASYGNRVRTV
jgi:hypothetical protein